MSESDGCGVFWKSMKFASVNCAQHSYTRSVDKIPSVAKEKIIKGGSFLCHENYCLSYRFSARMGNALDSSQEHVGFRTVMSIPAK